MRKEILLFILGENDKFIMASNLIQIFLRGLHKIPLSVLKFAPIFFLTSTH